MELGIGLLILASVFNIAHVTPITHAHALAYYQCTDFLVLWEKGVDIETYTRTFFPHLQIQFSTSALSTTTENSVSCKGRRIRDSQWETQFIQIEW